METITLPGEEGNIGSSLDYFLRFNVPKNAKILDIGCNFGSLAYNFYQHGYKDVHGVDVDGEAIEKGKKTYSEISKNLQHYDGDVIPFSDETFDCIVMFDVIEHIPAIKKFMKKQASRVLKKGGIFIFQTPNKYINIPWEIINHRSLTEWKNFHCSLQTRKSLHHLLVNSGFQGIKIEKNNILTDHNRQKVRKKIGTIGILILEIMQRLPLVIYPNLWGSSVRII